MLSSVAVVVVANRSTDDEFSSTMTRGRLLLLCCSESRGTPSSEDGVMTISVIGLAASTSTRSEWRNSKVESIEHRAPSEKGKEEKMILVVLNVEHARLNIK